MLGNKAIGHDQLKDTHIKLVLSQNEEIRSKCQQQINTWLNQNNIPIYLKKARVIALSKTASITPPVGEVRTIAILPAFSKLIERTIHNKLVQVLEENKLIHPNQRGFQNGASTINNLHDLKTILKSEVEKQASYRANQIPTARREKCFVLFLDLKKAFDSVRRDILI